MYSDNIILDDIRERIIELEYEIDECEDDCDSLEDELEQLYYILNRN